jgi:hypothetical protein
MYHKLYRTILSSSFVGFTLGLGVQVQAVTLVPPTTVLSDTPEFLDFTTNLFTTRPFTGVPPRLPGGLIPPGRTGPLYLGKNWNIQVNAKPNFNQGDVGNFFTIFVERKTPDNDLVGPQAAFNGGVARSSVSPQGTKRVTYLADAPSQVFDSVTCAFGSSNCVSYEFSVLPRPPDCGNCGDFLNPNPIYSIKGFFNASKQVPEGETGIGALAALGIIGLVRWRQAALKRAALNS